MKFEIKSRWDGSILFSVETESIKLAVELALKAKADLSGAVLRDAVLRDAVLSDAVLRDADLSGAVLSGAVLRDADLSGAVLRDADLRDADLSGAVLRDADLSGADLSGAVLRDAVLSGADLTPIRDDIWIVLMSAPAEVGFLRQALVEGKVNGRVYRGDCACLVGTIANARKCDVDSLGILKPNASRPAERFFLAIKTGDKPENSQFAKLAVEWIDQWIELQKESAKVFGK